MKPESATRSLESIAVAHDPPRQTATREKPVGGGLRLAATNKSVDDDDPVEEDNDAPVDGSHDRILTFGERLGDAAEEIFIQRGGCPHQSVWR